MAYYHVKTLLLICSLITTQNIMSSEEIQEEVLTTTDEEYQTSAAGFETELVESFNLDLSIAGDAATSDISEEDSNEIPEKTESSEILEETESNEVLEETRNSISDFKTENVQWFTLEPSISDETSLESILNISGTEIGDILGESGSAISDFGEYNNFGTFEIENTMVLLPSKREIMSDSAIMADLEFEKECLENLSDAQMVELNHFIEFAVMYPELLEEKQIAYAIPTGENPRI